MIKDWGKFNESNIPSYDDMVDKLSKANIDQLKEIFNDIKDYFIDFDDMGLILSYAFGGSYLSESDLSGIRFYPTPSQADIEYIADYYVPKYNMDWDNRFLSIGINFPYKEGGWISDNGIDLLDYLIESKNRLKTNGYKMDMCFWQTKFTETQIINMSKISPLEVRVYFDLDCKWETFITSHGKVVEI